MNKKILTATAAVILAGSVCVRGAFEDPVWSIRGAGKGGAYLASADDASGFMANPATLSEVFMIEGMFSYHKPYAGLDGINLSRGNLAFVYPQYRFANIGVAATTFDGDDLYKETTLQLSGAKELSSVIDAISPMQLSMGLSLKYLYHGYNWSDDMEALGDPITDTDGAGAVTADLGILFQPTYKFPIALSLNNLIPADVGIEEEDIVPMEVQLGAAYRMGMIGMFENVTPEFKVGYRNQEWGDDADKISYAAGIETWLAENTVGLRMGVNNNELAVGASYEHFLSNMGFRIDYTALLSNTIGDNLGSHRVATTVKF